MKWPDPGLLVLNAENQIFKQLSPEQLTVESYGDLQYSHRNMEFVVGSVDWVKRETSKEYTLVPIPKAKRFWECAVK